MNENTTKNPVGRPPMRPENPSESDAARAARRAAELREHLGDSDEGTDEFFAPTPPDGWSYEWKRRLTMGQEDHSYNTALLRAGWEAVPASRHPEMMPAGAKGPIERKGMILMERPKVIVEEARVRQLRTARAQVSGKEAQLNETPNNTLERAPAKVKKSYAPMPVPEE